MFMLANKGGGGQKSPKSCLRNLCTAPNATKTFRKSLDYRINNLDPRKGLF